MERRDWTRETGQEKCPKRLRPSLECDFFHELTCWDKLKAIE